MFTVKATYRGETRKLTFPDHLFFPAYSDLQKQLYRVFPINNSYHFSKLLFSPDAFTNGRILIATEVDSAAAYDRSIQQFVGRTYANALLRFTVFDDTPHKEPSRADDMQWLQTVQENLAQSRNYSNFDDRRPVVPPKPAGMIESTPFQYISSLSHTPSVASLRSSRRLSRAVAMDVDSTNSHGGCNGSCQGTDKALVLSLIDGLQKELDKGRSLVESASAASSSESTATAQPTNNERRCPARVRHSQLGSEAVNSTTTRHVSAANPEQVVHNNVWCDSCHKVIVGVRHKCLDCPDFDLCTTCITAGGAEQHNPFHEFFEITKPGRVIVHTVYADNQRTAAPTPVPAAPPVPTASEPETHNARCDLCDNIIVGDRYKCFDCPDYDTCATCFAITSEQHPGHSFMKMATDEVYIRRGSGQSKAHYATCNSCTQLIRGVRYKCMHPDCPDYDLCDKCESLPISVHPEAHPILKMKTTDTVIPTVYRVGGSQVLPQRPTIVTIPQDVNEHEEMRSVTPKPMESSPLVDVAAERPQMVQIVTTPARDSLMSYDPFADPVENLDSLASSFETTVAANRDGLASSSTFSTVSYPDAFELAAPRSSVTSPSFVDDLIAGYSGMRSSPQSASPVPVIGALNAMHIDEPDVKDESAEDIQEQPLAELISSNQSLIALAETKEEEQPIRAPTPVAIALPVEAIPVEVEATTVKAAEAAPVTPLSATFISDITVTDGQVFPPGAEFVKCWRMVNDSTRDWPEGTELVFVAGESLVIENNSEIVNVGSVKAGTEVDVWTGELKAPDAPGRYVGYWRLRDESGIVFGNSIWVEINVAETDHSSDDSMSASSIIMMPHAGSATSAAELSVRPAESTIDGEGTATIPSYTEDGNSDIDNDSDVSLIDLVSSDDEEDIAGWEDARSHATGNTRDTPARSEAASPAGANTNPDYVLLFDDSSDSDF